MQKRYTGKVSELFSAHSYTRTVLEASSSSSSEGDEQQAPPAHASEPSRSRAGQGSKGGKSSGVAKKKHRRSTTLRGARYTLQIEVGPPSAGDWRRPVGLHG